MELIPVPFKRDMIAQIFKNVKRCTWRTKMWGESGSGFELEHFGEHRRYEILGIIPLQPWYVAKYLYRPEGLNTPEEFLNYLQSLKRWHKLDVEQWGYEHFFTDAR